MSANERRMEKVAEGLSAMKAKPVTELPDFKEMMVSVSNNSTIRVRRIAPSRMTPKESPKAGW